MTTFDSREKAFEDKFAHDAHLKFLMEARRNKLLGGWAAEKLGLRGVAIENYIKSLHKADHGAPDHADVTAKIEADFKAKRLVVGDDEIHSAIVRFGALAAEHFGP